MTEDQKLINECELGDLEDAFEKIKDQPLKCEISNGVLTLSIGIGRLAFCAVQENGGPLDSGRNPIINTPLFAQDVVDAIVRDDETGATIAGDMLGKAIEKARDFGSAGIAYLGTNGSDVDPNNPPYPNQFESTI